MATFTKGHFETVAQVLRETPRRPAQAETDASLREMALRFAVIFAASNPRFDRARFLKACGGTE